MKFFSLFVLICFGLTSCRKSTTATDPETVFQKMNVPYGNAAAETMDLSFVAHRSDTTPLVVLLHGGAWMAGDKADLQQTVGSFTAQGINVANIDYRLTTTDASGVRAADLLADVGSALKMLHDQAGQWHIRSTGYVTFGFSAGAHLSLLYGYSYDSTGLVSAVIGLGTPTRFNDPAWGADPFLSVARSALPPLTGQPFDSRDTGNVLLKQLSPYYQSRLKPTFLMHGDKDQTVPFSQSQMMAARLEQSGIPFAFIPLPGAGHTGEGASEKDLNAAYGGAIAWIRTYSH